MSRSFLGLVVAGLSGVILAIPMLTMPAVAADYAVHPRQQSEFIDRGPNPYCGPRCGCPYVAFVRHRELRQTYPYTLDPRDRNEPDYSYGVMRTYARFGKDCAPGSPEY